VVNCFNGWYHCVRHYFRNGRISGDHSLPIGQSCSLLCPKVHEKYAYGDHFDEPHLFQIAHYTRRHCQDEIPRCNGAVSAQFSHLHFIKNLAEYSLVVLYCIRFYSIAVIHWKSKSRSLLNGWARTKLCGGPIQGTSQ
jgi:hypothetical protein